MNSSLGNRKGSDGSNSTYSSSTLTRPPSSTASVLTSESVDEQSGDLSVMQHNTDLVFKQAATISSTTADYMNYPNMISSGGPLNEFSTGAMFWGSGVPSSQQLLSLPVSQQLVINQVPPSINQMTNTEHSDVEQPINSCNLQSYPNDQPPMNPPVLQYQMQYGSQMIQSLYPGQQDMFCHNQFSANSHPNEMTEDQQQQSIFPNFGQSQFIYPPANLSPSEQFEQFIEQMASSSANSTEINPQSNAAPILANRAANESNPYSFDPSNQSHQKSGAHTEGPGTTRADLPSQQQQPYLSPEEAVSLHSIFCQ